MSNKRKLVNLFEAGSQSEISSEEESDEESKKAIAKNNLKEYYRQRPFKCAKKTDEGKKCPKAYKTKKGLLYHDNAIHRKIQFKCKYCSKEFSRKTCLEKHIERIHKRGIEPELRCDICAFTTTLKGTLRAHNLMFHGNLTGRVCCSLCSKTFESEETLQSHTQTFHQAKIDSTARPKTTASAVNLFSDTESSQASTSTGQLSQGRLLNNNAVINDDQLKAVAVMVSKWSSSVDVGFHRTRVGIVRSCCSEPDFNHMAQKHIENTKFSSKGEVQSMSNYTGDVSKRKSFYFAIESAHEAELAKTCIMITESFIELQRHFEQKKGDGRLDSTPNYSKSANVSLKCHNKALLDQMLDDNNIMWLMESKEEYIARRQDKDERYFSTCKPSKLISTNNLGIGHVYLVHATINGLLHIYIGKRNDKAIAQNGERGGRISSTAHEVRGSLHDLIQDNPEASFTEHILFYLTEEDEPEFPAAESLAILAFYMMQQSTGVWMKTEAKYVPCKLVNRSVVLPTWTQDYALDLRYLIYKYSKKRFSFVFRHGSELPAVPKVDSVFSFLKAKKFN